MAVRAALGLDVGTTVVKCLVIDETGTVCASARSEPLEVDAPQPGHAEQHPGDVWSAVVATVRATLSALEDSVPVDAMAVAAPSGSTIAFGPDGRELTPLVTWMDARAAPVVERWEADGTAARIRSITGWSPTPGLGLPLLVSMRDEARIGEVGRLAGLDAYVAHRLTGSWHTNPSNAAGLQLLDVERGTWSAELCSLAGIATEALPRVRASGALIGGLTAEAATETGLDAGLPVFGGAHDQAATALALGLVDTGDVLLSGGTAWVLTMMAESPSTEGVARDINVSHHAVPGRWCRSRLVGGFGADVAALAAEHGRDGAPDGTEVHVALDREVGAIGPTRDGVHFSTGAYHDATGRALPRTASARLPRAERARAVMEHAGYAVTAALAAADARDVIELTLVGGATAGTEWPRILADTTGLGIVLARSPSWPATGAALLAGAGAGLFESAEAAAARIARVDRRLEPDLGLAELYRLREQVHRTLEEER